MNHQYFQQRVQILNADQRRAVQAVEGPVMLLAGPGSGKTEVLAARIANILLTTDAEPHNILCLTFTNASVTAMRQRLARYIGAAAHHVGIHTFHSFCNEVIQDFSESFPVRDLEPIDELSQVQFLESALDALSADNPLFSKFGYTELYTIKSLIGLIKQENWSSQQINQALDEYLAQRKHDPEMYYKTNTRYGKKGDFRQAKYAKEVKKYAKLRAATDIFTSYQEYLRKQGKYDFADMILWVVDAFQKDEVILQHYQEQYQYILVDEYQDTSGSQNQLLHLLCSYWDAPNIFVVGDDDQSIYRFQGANVTNLIDFQKRYADSLQTILMTQNYRSTQKILDIAQGIIEHNIERLAGKKDSVLIASNPDINSLPTTTKIIEYDTSMSEAAQVANQIKSLSMSGQDLREIAVLYRKHRQAESFVDQLEALQVPFQIKKTVNVLELPLAKNILRIMHWVNDYQSHTQSRDHHLFHLLHLPYWNVSVSDIAKIYATTRIARQSFTDVVLDPEKLKTIQHLRGLDALLDFSQQLNDLLQRVETMRLPEFFEHVLNMGVLQWTQQQGDSIWQLRILTTLFQHIKELVNAQEVDSLTSYLALIEQMQRHHVSLPITQVTGKSDGVQLMTCHGAKGLEFEHVFVVGMQKSVWEKARESRQFTLPPTLPVSNAGDNEEELRRLFFVALTRAKQHLHVSFAQHDDTTGRDLERSQFVDEMLESPHVLLERAVSDAQMQQNMLIHALQATPHWQESYVDHDYVKHLLQNLHMSVTSLTKYLACAVQFYFEDLLRVPQAMNANMAFGSAIHAALEAVYRKGGASSLRSIEGEQILLDAFHQSLKKHSGHFSAADFDRKKAYGEQILQKYCAEKKVTKDQNIIKSDIEVSVRTSFDGIAITGKIDRIDSYADGSIAVIRLQDWSLSS